MSRDLGVDWLARAIALSDLGRLDDAEDALREALRGDPDDAVTHMMLALVRSELERPKDALESASTAIGLAPDLSLAHTARAQALLALERHAQAEQSAAEAIRLDPEDAGSRTVLAAILAARGRWAEARIAAEKALELEPGSETARGLRAYTLAMSERGSDWEEAARETLAAAPDTSVAHALAGSAHLLGGQERQAVERFHEALRLDPESDAAQAGLATALKAAHPLFRPFFRFFVWQERLPRGWKIALTFGPLVVVRGLRLAADNPFVIALIVLWILLVASTWLSVPIANLALRFSTVGRSVLPSGEKRSSSAFLALIGLCLLAIVLAIVVDGSFTGAAIATGLLALPLGSAHEAGPRLRRGVYAGGVAVVIAGFVGGMLVAVGLAGPGAILLLGAFFLALVLLWVVRLS
jgi:Flp pilus assembly protein TadD